jgi:signal transduction histidine kinase/CheY-like chemotaxis protein
MTMSMMGPARFGLASYLARDRRDSRVQLSSNQTGATTEAIKPLNVRRPLFRKYFSLFGAAVCLSLVVNGLIDIWFSYQEHKGLLLRVQREQAEAAGDKITRFITEIEGQMAWATARQQWSADSFDEWRYDAVRLLHQVPAISEVAQIDALGREQARISRYAVDVVGSLADFSHDPGFVNAIANKVYYGPVYFSRESEPYMTLAIASARREYGVVIAQVNLKFILDVISQIVVGNRGQAYVIDSEGRLIAHPDISLVLRHTDASGLSQVHNAISAGLATREEQPQAVTNLQGQRVLSTFAPIGPLKWFVFAELPIEEAYAPLYSAILRSGGLLLGTLVIAFLYGLLLARRMIVPIQAMHDGAASIGAGDLSQRISINTGDELEALGNQFNSMAAKLQDSYAMLERRVEERTQQLELANLAKSRFLATASHDLRQPLHALGLFVAQLRARMSAAERQRVIGSVEASVTAMNELFSALLDVSKLDAGALKPDITEFPIDRLLKRIEATFTEAAREKGLSLRVIPSAAWVRSDFILLEQVLFNLTSNAIRYTANGGVLVGCRRHGSQLRIEVLDTGIGIPLAEHHKIFGEFYRLGESDRGQRGLGLGLAIVDRIGRLLDHPIGLTSTVGKGSRFSVAVPLVAARSTAAELHASARIPLNSCAGKLVAIVDDDQLVLDGMRGLLCTWGCQVVAGRSGSAVLSGLFECSRPPDLIICDYHLLNGKTGIEVIERLRSEFGSPIPAFLMSGDVDPECLRKAQESGYRLQHKPVDPMVLRAMCTQLLKTKKVARAPEETVQ